MVIGDLIARHSFWLYQRTNKNGKLIANQTILALTRASSIFRTNQHLSSSGNTSTLDLFLSDRALAKPPSIHGMRLPGGVRTAPKLCSDNSAGDEKRLRSKPIKRSNNNWAHSRTPSMHAVEVACIRLVMVKRHFFAIDAHTWRLIQQRNTVRRQF